MITFQISKGYFARVSDGDVGLVVFKWTADVRHNKDGSTTIYAYRRPTKREKLYLHQAVSGKKFVDHRDGDGLNNQRENLRSCSYSQNGINKGKKLWRGRASSIHKGIYWEPTRARWHAQLKIGGRVKFLGRFKTESEAIAAWQRAVESHPDAEWYRNSGLMRKKI